MPYVNIKITREGATAGQKAELIRGVTDLLLHVLDKRPATTFVVIDEVEKDDWGIGGVPGKTPKPNEARLQRHANRTSRRISWDLKLVTSRYHRTGRPPQHLY